MERWVRGREPAEPIVEPDEIETFPVKTLQDLSVEVPANKGFGELRHIYTRKRGFQVPVLGTAAQLQKYQKKMLASLKDLLGMSVVLPRATNGPKTFRSPAEGELIIEHVGYPSEGGILVPTIVVRRERVEGKLPVTLVFSEAGRDALLAEMGPDSPRRLAQDGSLVVLPDVRCYGEMFSTSTSAGNNKRQDAAWQRNGIVWGRPVPGMACTDIQGVLDGLASRPDADMARVKVISRKSGDLAIAGLFAIAIDSRITEAELDLAGCCFQKRNLPLVSCVIQHGDVLQWAALAAGRKLTLRNVPPEAGDPAWLHAVACLVGNRDGVRVNGKKAGGQDAMLRTNGD